MDHHHAAVPGGDVNPEAALKMQLLDQKTVLILGLGASGLSMARWCARQGAQVVVADTRQEPPRLAQLHNAVPNARFVGGEFTAQLLGEGTVQAVFKSPGLSPAQIAPVVQAAQAAGLWVCGELGLFTQALAYLKDSQAYAPEVLAITGTNGKTTVTALTGQLLARCAKAVAVAGNIGPTLLDTLAAQLDAQELAQVWVLELSSFQLDGETGFEPYAATVLNLSEDHLDWHGSMQAYAEAKATIFGQHTVRILNRDDPLVMAMVPEPVKVKGQRVPVADYVSFGADLPTRAGDFGMEDVNGMRWLVRAVAIDDTVRKRGEVPTELHIQRLMPADALRIRGRHNAANALAALALASTAGCAMAPMLHGLREYRGEPHRVQPVGIVNGVEYFDDSKGTNVGATVAALEGLGVDRKVIAILGGDGKGQDFSPLSEPVRRFARGVVLIGRDAPLIEKALQGIGVAMWHATSMQDAVAQASAQAQQGDAVLMSPACASFDMFNNYEHRAQVFVACVQALALDAGLVLEAAT